MKKTLLSLMLFTVFTAIADNRDARGLQMPTYNVTSDQISAEVPTDQCRIIGTVYYDYKPLDSVEVATLDRSVSAFTADTGKYQILIDAGDTSIFAYRKLKGEVVVWNYPFQGGHEVKIDFYFNSISKMVITAKPVIYMYSPEDISAHVSFRASSSVTHTYPTYKDGWNVVVKKEGGVQHNERMYPYLFWEGEHEGYTYEAAEGKVYGFLTATEQLIGFFEEKLNQLGLNQTEKTDFITFWTPKLIQKDYVFIQFQVDEGVANSVSDLTVFPRPDSQRRIYMLCTPLDQAVPPEELELSPQVLPSFERKGFSVVEWGGSIIDLNFEEL